MDLKSAVVAVVGLGYVGLPVAIALAAHHDVIAYDADPQRVNELASGFDATGESAPGAAAANPRLTLTADTAALHGAGVFIVAVPTPVDDARQPDLSRLRQASEVVAGAMQPGAVVIYESTVYPGCTRHVCVPILEEGSGLTFNDGFFVGYSPERINPGDPAHRLETIVKVTAGSTEEAAAAIHALYARIVPAGTHRASSIEVAEAAKVIENTQRDLNIALMNELAILFHRLGLDTHEVLEAAGTKWNFLPFRPGLVGGHCIGVDPYYLTHRAQEVGHHPEVILAGRRINDLMGAHVVDRVMRLMMARRLPVVGSRVLVMGLAFKENCADVRNTKVIDVVRELSALNAVVDVWDPWVEPRAAEALGATLVAEPEAGGVYDAVILAVAHTAFVDAGPSAVRQRMRPDGIFFDVKGAFAKEASDGRL